MTLTDAQKRLLWALVDGGGRISHEAADRIDDAARVERGRSVFTSNTTCALIRRKLIRLWPGMNQVNYSDPAWTSKAGLEILPAGEEAIRA